MVDFITLEQGLLVVRETKFTMIQIDGYSLVAIEVTRRLLNEALV